MSQSSIEHFPEPLKKIIIAGIAVFLIYWFVDLLWTVLTNLVSPMPDWIQKILAGILVVVLVYYRDTIFELVGIKKPPL